nr:hypothetical protein [Tanacetum cinerariifolium]
MLLEGFELTKEDQESQLYDDFEHFRQYKGESIHDYYVWFAKLINDMRNIKMTMSKMQLNSKFVNNMLPEWGRFVTVVKFNRGLGDSNYDQLYAYLKQHKTHAKEKNDVGMILSEHKVPQHLADNLNLDSSLSLIENLIKNLTNTLALLTQSYKTFLPQTNNQLRTSSNARNQATVQDGRVVVQNVQGRQNRGQGMNPQGRGAAGYGGALNRFGNVNPGQARPDNAFDDDVDEQPVQDLALNVDNVFQADDYPVTYEAGPSYDSDIVSEVQDHDHYRDAVCAQHEEHAMHESVQLNYVVESHADYMSDSNMIPYDQYVKDNEVPVVHSNVSSIPNDDFMMIYNDTCEPHA